MATYYYVAASENFLTEEEPLAEVLKERRRNYAENSKEIDFWLVRKPSFLNATELNKTTAAVPRPAAAVISTDRSFIDFMKLRLEFVLKGEFEAPSETIPDPLASEG
ncbi:MAG: DUF2488 family protein [Synechococcaceae bacterium WBB_32_011]|nr:DUF2488 family protein [Synechococcaceae bacterium WB6_3A_227]NDA75228.1 DUF2488 family protein [Synechococcaceae bacterium WB8_3_299]NDD20839.1 DUF2488 family protein [Synechococcaceae bacterium WBA_3_309]NDE22525.1 DUF2488 family protein [Synechococcaceae bacterium WB9_3_282]NDG00735.1 DUF2488 family protein [Synechococcaceae bacterium WBB_32_011]